MTTLRLTWLLSCAIAPLFRAEAIEVNVVTHHTGEPRFVQSITWDAHPWGTRVQIAGWVMIDEGDRVVEMPHGAALVRSKIDEHPAVIRARRVEFTVTPFDIEELHRWVLPTEERTGLE